MVFQRGRRDLLFNTSLASERPQRRILRRAPVAVWVWGALAFRGHVVLEALHGAALFSLFSRAPFPFPRSYPPPPLLYTLFSSSRGSGRPGDCIHSFFTLQDARMTDVHMHHGDLYCSLFLSDYLFPFRFQFHRSHLEICVYL